MNEPLFQSRELVLQAREALRRNDRDAARLLGEQAALLSPDFEDAWLVLAASDDNPEDALAYARKAEELNPTSPRARRAVEWAQEKLNQAQRAVKRVEPVVSEAPRGIPLVRESRPVPVKENPKPRGRLLLYGATFGLLACVVIGFAAWSAFSSPAFASVLNPAPQPTQENLWARVDVPKPAADVSMQASPIAQSPAQSSPIAQAPLPTETATPVPALPTATLEPAATPTSVPTDAPTAIPSATETPGVLAMDILADTPTSAYVPPTSVPTSAVANDPQPSYPSQGNGVRWIDVDLTNQMVYAYEGDVIVNSFVVSTGTAYTPTVTGKFKIWIKLKKTNMSGPGYYLADVPYTMYFYKGYGLHGTYWHNNFGTPMSHGCVNLSIPDAEWLYYFASEGTVVNVHY
jgi:lipoprotein-anchoring transpeptidase ErfK/SrfK